MSKIEIEAKFDATCRLMDLLINLFSKDEISDWWWRLEAYNYPESDKWLDKILPGWEKL